MTNSKDLFRELIASISINEPKEEKESIVYLFMEKILNIFRSDIMTERRLMLDESHHERIDDFIRRINSYEPVQYVIGQCDFYGRTFLVDKNVLIPRPETEELVKEVIHCCKGLNRPCRILDIGTGSGCIAITLKLEIPNPEVYAIDVSDDALLIARRNARQLQADVNFVFHDILKREIPFNNLDILVSNPPYVTTSEKDSMSSNVLQFEPHLALFVPDNDPLLFYKAIVDRSEQMLRPGGLIVFEVNEKHGKEVADILVTNKYRSVEIIKDIFGKERIVKGFKTE
jgi:release factor glutamine methyltransferase